jgi:arsenate reductase-like glutaredoxin family protein
MAPKRAKFYTYGDDERCHETRKFIEEAGVILEVRDISEKPLTYDELDSLYGHCEVRHFLNPLSSAYSKNGLDRSLPERDKLLQLMADDHTLIRQPIIKCTRLMTVGCDKKKISEMLQIGQNGSGGNVESRSSRTSGRMETARSGR